MQRQSTQDLGRGSHQHVLVWDVHLTSMVLTELSPAVMMVLMAPSTTSYALAPASVYACPCNNADVSCPIHMNPGNKYTQ